MDESLGYLVYAFIVAIVLVYMIMASQFESLIHPFTIMLSVPMAIIGVAVTLSIHAQPLGVMAAIGLITFFPVYFGALPPIGSNMLQPP